MRVLFVAHSAPRAVGDAAGSFVLRLAVALQARGIEVTLIAPHAAGLAMREAIEGVTIERVRYAADRDETLAYSGTLAQQVAASWRARWALVGLLRALRRAVADRAQTVDVVHAHWWFPSGLAAAVASRAGRPLVTTLHGSDVRLARAGLPRRLFRAVATRSDRVTAVSSWLADAMQQATGCARPDVAPMPIDTATFRSAAGPREGLLFVGRLNRQKGLHVLIAALPQIDPALGPLTVIGDGPDEPDLRAQAEAAGVAARIRWVRSMPQQALVPAYQQARVVILPATEAEGLGLVAVEARACGAAIVASSIGGLVDVAGDAADAVLVPPNDPSALATAVNAVPVGVVQATAPERLAAFAPSVAAARYAEIYEAVLRKVHA
jgi:glycosyltransferase involved in cell wall biosynthesis